MLSRITVVLASALLLTLLLVAPAQAAFPGANGRIAYEYGHATIYSISPDGTGQTALFSDPYSGAGNPAWSANGRKIAFNNYGEIWVMNADGINPHNLTTNPDDHPSWSPDGSKIVFSTTRDQALPIYVMNADGSTQRSISPNPPQLGDEPAWSPDGTKVAFRGYTPTASGRTQPHVYMMNANGTGVTNLTPDFAFAGGAEWAPDSSRIVFYGAVTTGDFEDLYTANPDGSGRVQVTATPLVGESSPAWSPDGRRIAYVERNKYGAADDIEIINADGSGEPFRLTFGGAHNGEPDWQPIIAPERSDYKNAAEFCKAERAFLGDAAFARKYGSKSPKKTVANAYGRCVSGK
jgi:TolB protein